MSRGAARSGGWHRVLNRVQVVPLSSKTAKVYPGQALVMVGDRQSKAVADQTRSVSKLRLRGCLGVLDATDLAAIERAIRVQLTL